MRSILVFAFLLFSSFGVYAQMLTGSLKGLVLNQNNGQPIPNHTVYIFTDSTSFGQAYWNTVVTDINGMFIDNNIPLLSGNNTLTKVYAKLMDCQGQAHEQFAMITAQQSGMLTFSICGENNNQDCVSNFSYQYASMPNSAFFQKTSPGLVAWWDFGDGTVGYEPAMMHQFPGPGTYQVCLWTFQYLNNQDTCMAQSCQMITLQDSLPSCHAAFTYTNVQPGLFALNGIATGMGPFQYKWLLNGSVVGVGQNFNLNLLPGTHQVCLTIQSANGCVDTECKQIVVNGQNTSCSAEFGFQINNNNKVQFNTPPNPNLTYHWTFGDGEFANVPNPFHIYTQPGTYEVCLYVWGTLPNGVFCSDTLCKNLIIQGEQNNNCEAAFNHIINGNTVQFNTPPNNTFNYFWQFGNGQSSILANPTITYNQPGTYDVCLTVWKIVNNVDTCTNTKCKTIVIQGGENNNCSAQFVFQINNNNKVQFNTQPNPNLSYHWTFGDGEFANVPNPFHIYTQPGNYQVCLYVWGTLPNGVFCSDTLCKNLVIQGGQNTNCEAKFNFQLWGNTVYFNNQSAPNLVYKWNFGDGQTATVAHPTHTYAAPGQYEVCLTVYGVNNVGDSCMHTKCKMVNIIPNNANCDAQFAFFQQGSTVSFINNSVSTPVAHYYWYFGDGEYAETVDATHTYALPGTYTACLYMQSISQNGAVQCMDSTCKTIIIPGTQQTLYSICGQVTLNGQPVGGAVVTLIQIENNSYQPIQTLNLPMMDTTGTYCFTGLSGGTYMVMALLVDSSALGMPTYAGDTLFWLNATIITLQNSNQTANIELVTADGIMVGPGFIGGILLSDFGKTASLTANVPILLFSENGRPLGYVRTDANGNFSFPNVAYGTYRLHVEMPGKYTVDKWVTISESTPIVNDIQLQLSNTVITTAQAALNEYRTVGLVFPSPATDAAMINLHFAQPTMVQVSIMDLTGKVLNHYEAKMNGGFHLHSLPIENLAAGSYIANISFNGQAFSRKFVKATK